MNKSVRYKVLDQISFADHLVFSKLPKHAFWSNVEQKIDFSFADRLCAFLYSSLGQHPYAPSLKLKIHLVQAYHALSDRGVEEKIIGDLFIKRFLGVSVEFFGFDHSTVGLDRQRMGEALFASCHLYILAQLYAYGLWGDPGEAWIIDSFPCEPGIAMLGARRLIQKTALRVLQQMRRANPALHQATWQTLTLDAFTKRLPRDASPSDQLLTFSQLVAQAHALLRWLQLPEVTERFTAWSSPAAKECSSKAQAVLRRVLAENSRLATPNDDNSTPPDSQPPMTADDAPAAAADTAPVPPDHEPAPANHDQTATLAEQPPGPDTAADPNVLPAAEGIVYEKKPRAQRPADRIICAHDPEARHGKKTPFQVIDGYKIQNVCTSSGVVVAVKVIPANEHDRDATEAMIRQLRSSLLSRPDKLLGDTCYGHGVTRKALQSLGVEMVAPVPPSTNPTGLNDSRLFTYDREADRYRCPNGKESVRKSRSKKLCGTQYHFGAACADCPLQASCTTSKAGRSVFRSDDADLYAKAAIVNASEEGEALLKQRWLVERKNEELKNDCELGHPKTRSRAALSIKAVLAAIVVNLKYTVRRLCAPKPGFLRRTKYA